MAKQTGSNGECLIGDAVNISNATHLAGTVTIDTGTAHGKAAGDMIEIASVVGMTDLNGVFPVVSAPDADTLTVTLTTAQTYSSGGTVQGIVPIISWSKNSAEPALDTTDSTHSGWRTRQAKEITAITGTITGYITSLQKPGNLLGESLAIKLYQDTGNYWSGSAIFTNIEETVDVPGEALNQVTFNWEGTGAWSETS